MAIREVRVQEPTADERVRRWRRVGAAAEWVALAGGDQAENTPGDPSDDCWTSPSILAADSDAPNVVALYRCPSTHFWQPVPIADAVVRAVSTVPDESLLRTVAAEGRHTYLSMRRLRIRISDPTLASEVWPSRRSAPTGEREFLCVHEISNGGTP